MSEGLRVRLSRIRGETPKGILRQPLYLPAVMRGFGWTEEFSHVEYDTVSAGQFSQAAQGPKSARQLRQLDDIETLTLKWDPVWLVEQGLDPKKVYDELFGVGRSRAPVQLYAAPRFPGETKGFVRMNVTVRSISVQLREREPDTRYFVLRIVEWRSNEVERRRAGKAGDRLPTTHILTATDTLYSLSQHYYHYAGGTGTIAAANGIKGFGKKTPLVKHKRLKVGTKIKIPKPPTHGANVQSGRGVAR